MGTAEGIIVGGEYTMDSTGERVIVTHICSKCNAVRFLWDGTLAIWFIEDFEEEVKNKFIGFSV